MWPMTQCFVARVMILCDSANLACKKVRSFKLRLLVYRHEVTGRQLLEVVAGVVEQQASDCKLK